jgi:hypothetical protein
VIAKQLAGSGKLVHAGDLATAVREAFIRSRPGDTVLLAPACSSFDQFKDYEQRGRVFKELVKQLARDVSAGAIARQKHSDTAAQGPPSTPGVVVHPVEPVETEKPSESPATVVEPPPHHLELSYVYEVETVEMPPVELEAQISPEEEPAISPPASETEAVADEPLPFETRAGIAAGASPATKKDTAKGRGRSKAGDHQDAPRSSAETQARLPGLD